MNSNIAAGKLNDSDPTLLSMMEAIVARMVAAETPADEALIRSMLMERRDNWLAQVRRQEAHHLGYREDKDGVVGLLCKSGAADWELFTCLNSLRDVEGTVNLIYDSNPRGLRLGATEDGNHE